MTKERILCAAIWYKEIEPTIPQVRPYNIDRGMVILGYRHGHCIWTLKSLTRKRTCSNGDHCSGDFIQGFLTSLNRFVDRKEGREIHLANGNKVEFEELYSEDLY